MQHQSGVVGKRYRLHELLGEGGMGAVWRATDELLHREVAIKKVQLRGEHSPEANTLAKDRIMREARIAAALFHPNIVSIFDVVVDGGEPWLVLEYLPSHSLGSIMTHRRFLHPAEVATIGAQIAHALAAAHAARIVHRDVKPDNILIADRAPSLVAKLTDFGISHAATAPALTSTNALTGTPAFFAPEAARGEHTDASADVYSLGATLYAAAHGAPPYGNSDGNVFALLGRIGRGGPPPPRCPEPLAGILRDMLADERALRPSAAQAAERLAAAAHRNQGFAPPPAHSAPPTLFGQPVLPIPQPHSPPGLPPGRRRWPWIAAAIVAVVAIAAATTVFVINQQPGQVPPGGSAAATSSTAPDPPQQTISDPRTADPCSLLDEASVQQFGELTPAQDNTSFSSCRIDISPSDGGQASVFADFQTANQAGSSSGARYEQFDNLTLARFDLDSDGTRCSRRITLPDRNVVHVYTDAFSAGSFDLCTIAEAAATATVKKLQTSGIGERVPLDQETSLATAQACELLSPTDLATVPGTSPTGTAGFGDWSCHWSGTPGNDDSAVFLDYYRRYPLTADDGTAIDIQGRPGSFKLVPGKSCFTQFAQRQFTAPDGNPLIDAVRITAYGPLSDEQLCAITQGLARAAAGRLP